MTQRKLSIHFANIYINKDVQDEQDVMQQLFDSLRFNHEIHPSYSYKFSNELCFRFPQLKGYRFISLYFN